jgi:Family of unknown function (DUF5985)
MTASTAGFLAGLIAMCFAAIGVCFVRYWTLRRDPLLAAFAAAFWLLALQQVFAGLTIVPREEQSWVYLLRVAAFAVIAAAIIWKNMAGRRRRAWSERQGSRLSPNNPAPRR